MIVLSEQDDGRRSSWASHEDRLTVGLQSPWLEKNAHQNSAKTRDKQINSERAIIDSMFVIMDFIEQLNRGPALAAASRNPPREAKKKSMIIENGKSGFPDPKAQPPWNLYLAAKNRMASNMLTTQGLLDRLARDPKQSVQLRVAENLNTSTQTLDNLSHHKSSAVRSAVAQNRSSTSATIARLSSDENPDVRYALAEDAGTTSDVLDQLADDENAFVQDRAKRTRARNLNEHNIL